MGRRGRPEEHKWVDGFFTSITLKKWDRRIKVAIYRKRVFHETRKNYQLDLCDPDDGTWEYFAVGTNLEMGVRRLWRFMAGRGLHEKIIGELKSALALECHSAPTSMRPTAPRSSWSCWRTIC